MRRIFRWGLVCLGLMCFVNTSVQADETVVDTPKTLVGITPLALNPAEDGSETNPYQVANLADLKLALAKPIVSGNSALYIRLVGDIVYVDNDKNQQITKNFVLDGNGHYIRYSEKNYDQSLFETGKDNLTITFKNLKYDDAASYYGMLYTSKNNINFIVENIDWDVKKGSQPFYSTGNSGNTLTFKGTNRFKSDGTDHGGEFVEGFPNVIFADDSQTTVYNDTSGTDGFFYCGKQKITVGKRASVEFTTSKPVFIYDGSDAKVDVQESGKFVLKFISGTNHKSSTSRLLGGIGSSITFNFAEDAIGHFTTAKDAFSGTSPTINATSPEYILFEASPSSKSVLANLTPKFVRKDSDGYTYPIAYFKDGQKEFVANVTGTQSVSASNISSGNSVVYARAPKIKGLDAVPTVGRDISQIAAQISQYSPATLSNGNSKLTYKLATKQLYTENDITTAAAQTSITNAFPNQGVVREQDIWLPSDVTASSAYQFTALPAQTYYLYTRIEGRYIPGGYTLTSPWVENVVSVPSYIEVTLPDSLEFLAVQAGAFGKSHHLSDYTAVNHGNVPISLDLKSLRINPTSSPNVSLIDQCIDKRQVSLKLVAENATGLNNVIWEPIVAGMPIPSKPFILEPFWESGRQASFYVKGEHSVSVTDGGPYKIDYNLTLAVKAAP